MGLALLTGPLSVEQPRVSHFLFQPAAPTLSVCPRVPLCLGEIHTLIIYTTEIDFRFGSVVT